MIIIRINAYHADSSAAIFVDRKLVAAIEEERLTRIKHWAGFPSQSIAFCLKRAGVTYDQVDCYAIGRDPWAKFSKKMMYVLKNPLSSSSVIRDRFKNSKKAANFEDDLANMFEVKSDVFKNKIYHVEHHRSHIASAFYSSPNIQTAITCASHTHSHNQLRHIHCANII